MSSALKDTKEKNGALFSSIISAAQRKVKRKPNKPSSSLSECKDEPVSPTNLKVFPTQSFSTSDIKEVRENICILYYRIQYKNEKPAVRRNRRKIFE